MGTENNCRRDAVKKIGYTPEIKTFWVLAQKDDGGCFKRNKVFLITTILAQI
jgi:hypothetical protein